MSEKKNQTGRSSGLEALALMSQLGWTITIPIVLGAVTGHWIDGKLGTGMIFFLILLCLGIAGGIAGAYHLVIALGKKKK